MKQVVVLLFVGLLAASVAAQVPGGAVPPPLGPPIRSDGQVPAPSPPEIRPADPLARWIGRWDVEFADGTHEVHELRKDRSVTVKIDAQNYSTKGYSGFDGERVTIIRNGGGLERWTPVGNRMVVEYWYSSSELQTKPAFLAIGEREE